MREYQHKHIVRTLFYSKVTMVILFLLIMLLLRSVMELNSKRLEAKEKEFDARKEKEELQEKVGKAEYSLRHIETKEGYEEYIRTTFPVVKEGEGVIVVYDDDKVPVSEVRTIISPFEKMLLWWNTLFNK